jgi:hypothetical protein
LLEGADMMRMNEPVEAPARLVVVEDPARVPADFLLKSTQEGDGVTVLVQDHDTPRTLAARTMRRLADVERAGNKVNQAVVVVGAGKDADALAARCVLVRVLLAHLVRAGSGEVVLAAEGVTDSELRHQLLALAGTLAGEVGASGVAIRVRFEPDPPPLARTGARSPERDAERAVA